VFKPQPKRSPNLDSISFHRAITAVFVLLALQVSVVVWELPDLRGILSLNEVAMVLRVAGVEMVTKCPWWLGIFRDAHFVYIPLLVLLRKHRAISRWAFVAVILVSTALSLSRMTRAPLLGISLTLWGSWALLYRRPAVRAWFAMGVTGAVIALVFLVSQPVIDSPQGRVLQTVQVFEPYFGGSMHAFETIVEGTFPRSPGVYSADMVYYVLNKFDLVSPDSYPSIVRPYGDNHTNVYTFLDAFTLDGGIIGAFMGSFIIGLLGGVLFNKASRRNSLILITAYSSLCYYIGMSILNNEFIRINVVVTVVLAAVTGLLVCRRSPAQNRMREFSCVPIRAGGAMMEPATRR
jgi:hypothetical protein